MSYQCAGMTALSLQCKNKIKSGKYCRCHMYSHEVYRDEPGWPKLSDVRKSIKTVNDASELMLFIRKQINFSTNINQIAYTRTTFILITETLLKYRNMIYGVDCWERIIIIVLEKLSDQQHLNVYSENIKQKLLVEYRKLAQQKYITHIFKNVLNFDCASVIASFV